MTESSPIDVREDAIIHIGHIAYMGGRDASKAAAIYMPQILELFMSPKFTSFSTRIACLKCISEMCHGHRKTRENLGKDTIFMEFIISLINKSAQNDSADKVVRVGRWACYALLMIMNANPKVLEDLRDMDDLHDALTAAADYKRPWTGWGGNIADHNLKLLYHRDPSEDVLPL